ncbi:MAG: GNA1162 family protein [Nitrospirota bacterium]
MKVKALLLAVFISMFIFSCAPPSEVKKDIPEITVSEEEMPRMVAVLPFQNETQETGIANQVRRAFYNHFSSKPYTDVELNIVDEKIIHLEKSTGKNILDLKPHEICQSIGCDGLIYGRVTDYKKVYAVAYSQLGVEAEVWMVNTRTGKEVFRIKDSVRYHEGGVPMSPLSVIMTAVSTAMNIREIQQVRMVNELCYKFNEKIPSPTGVAIEERPVIKEVLTNVKEGPFGKGKIIRVGLEGDKGLVATFDIGNFKKGIPMKETKPGIYMGEYLVMPGDNAKDMPIVASLKKPGGYESQWIDVSGFLTIDTTPPPQVTGLRAKGFHERIEVLWEQVKNIPDLKGYRVLRSEQPLSGYGEIGSVELNSFEDRTAMPEKVYYYRIVAFDYVGNESEIQDAVRASLMTKEPVMLAGEIKKDTVLSGVYIVKDAFAIPKGLSLTIEPETRIMFDENAFLAVFGKIVVNGKESPVEFISSGEKKWKGVIVDGGNIMMNGFRIKNTDVGLSAKNSEGVIENGVITDSDTGISISGTPSITVKSSAISGSKKGIELIKTDAKIAQNNIFQNGDGILIKGFSGEIKDNNIFDNERNITSEGHMRIGANYLGSINTDEMKVSNINIAKTYDNRVPDGKIVDAISNPYASMSQEDRQKKATEFVIEAGNYFRQRNYGKASSLFEEALKAYPTAEVYYYLALCYQEMKEDEKSLKYLRDGVEKFPKDSTLQKSLGLMYYQKGNEVEAKKVFEEVLRLSPEDRQVRFLIERIGK